MHELMFSIIMPVYNAEKFLVESIDSILKQTYENFELIIVDDGSIDSSPKICDSYAENDSRIKVIHQMNAGQTSARKRAAELAHGEYTVCIDSDDWIDKDYLKSFYDIIYETRADIVCAGMKRVFGSNIVDVPINYKAGLYRKVELEKKIYPILIQPAIGEGFTVSLWGKAILSKLYKEFQKNVDSKLRMGEDLACFLPCVYHAESIYILNNCMYYYRDNPDSYTKKKNVYNWDGPERIHDCLVNGIDVDRFDFQDQLYRRILREVFLVTTSQFNRNEKYKNIKQDILLNLSRNIYGKAIKNARFGFKIDITSLRYSYYSFALKHRCIWMVKLYNKYLYR